MLLPNNNYKIVRTTRHSLYGVALPSYPTSHFHAKNSSATRITCPIFQAFHCCDLNCAAQRTAIDSNCTTTMENVFALHSNFNIIFHVRFHFFPCVSDFSAVFFCLFMSKMCAQNCATQLNFHVDSTANTFLFQYLFTQVILIDLTNGYDTFFRYSLFGCCFPLSVAGSRNHLQHMQKRDSKSFDSGSLYRPDVDDDSNGTSSMERIERNDSKIMLPTPPIRKSPLATASANQSEDHSITSIDRNKTDTNNTVDGHDDSNKSETEPTATEPNEVCT